MMAFGKNRQGSGVSIGGNNNAPIQNVVGEHISDVRQSAPVQGVVDVDAVRGLLTAFRADLDRNETVENIAVLRAMADTLASSLDQPEVKGPGRRKIAQTLLELVLGTVVQQTGAALAQALLR